MLYTEGIVWYLILLDCVIYNIMSWSKGKWHKKLTHWLSGYFPLNRYFASFYLVITLWLGYTLYRMNLLGFHFG